MKNAALIRKSGRAGIHFAKLSNVVPLTHALHSATVFEEDVMAKQKDEEKDKQRIALRITNDETFQRIERLRARGFNISEIARQISMKGLNDSKRKIRRRN